MVSYGCLLGAKRTPSFIACFPLQLAKQHCAIISPFLPSSPLRSILRARTEKCSRRYNYASVCKKKRGARNKRLSSF